MNSPRNERQNKSKQPAPVEPRLTRSLDDALGYQLRRAQEASFAAFARRAGTARIWPGWYALLTIISDNPGINQTDLSKASGRDKSTLTATLRELGKEELIERVRDDTDRRSFQIYLSEKGKIQLAELSVHAKAHDRQLDAIVGQPNRRLLLAMLRDLTDSLAENIPD